MNQTNESPAVESTLPAWYELWIADYLVTFGRATDEGLAHAMRRWWRGFALLKYTESELTAATLRIVAGAAPIPKFPDDALERVRAEVRDIRAQAARRATPRYDDEPRLSYAEFKTIRGRHEKAWVANA